MTAAQFFINGNTGTTWAGYTGSGGANVVVDTGLTSGTLSSFSFGAGGTTYNMGLLGIEVDGVVLINNGSTLTLTDNTNLSSMTVGDTLQQDSAYTPVTSAITSVSSGTYSGNLSGSINNVSASVTAVSGGAFGGNTAGYSYINAGNPGDTDASLLWTQNVSGITSMSFYSETTSTNGMRYRFDGGAWTTLTTNNGFAQITVSSPPSSFSTFEIQTNLFGTGGLSPKLGTVVINGVTYLNSNAPPILNLTNNTDLSIFAVGDAVTEVGGGADASGVIGSIGATSLTLSSSTGGWSAGSTVQGPALQGQGTITNITPAGPTITLSGVTSRFVPNKGQYGIDTTVTPFAPTTSPPNSTIYTAITGSPFTVSASPFTTVDVLQSALTVSSTYYARVKYATTNTAATTSSFSAWSSFGTAAAFVPNPGTAMAGGYFGGQSNDGGTIYNLIVAPVADGQYPGGGSGGTPTTVQYKTTNSADAPSATFQNEVYGSGATTAGNDSFHPAFQWASALNIGGFNDWYIPAKNELSVLYFFLKPTTAGNNTSTGSNANSVSPYTPNTNYGTGFPSQTTSTLFQSAGSESFAASTYYWTSTENAGSTANAYAQNFIDGEQNGTYPKDYTAGIGIYARAIRRVAA